MTFGDAAGSSPRERGSSRPPPDWVGAVSVVPARAGVIHAPESSSASSSCRPRASGGHPATRRWPSGSARSSPRERGSSPFGNHLGTIREVVPARAGVIRACPCRSTSTRRRPRASGGHPVAYIVYAVGAVSSPRERGSSHDGHLFAAHRRVVPARAGVIRSTGSLSRSGCSRPRASGGHPSTTRTTATTAPSSPRERGSSGVGVRPVRARQVVPARAGVIRTPPPPTTSSASRPRASGGHPMPTRARKMPTASSPRERGSSGLPRQRVGLVDVVPARAGVIPVGHHGPGAPRRRPRASGGHPTSILWKPRTRWSSPRERGSSPSGRPCLRRQRVVPARAGVIRRRSWRARFSGSRPRASGGHPSHSPAPAGFTLSSPRERGSSAPGPRLHASGQVVPARAGVIRVAARRRRRCPGRPRASGGHPPLWVSIALWRASSPRERGSSLIEPFAHLRAVRRPRASGGHPAHHPGSAGQQPSSPRERGSSDAHQHPLGALRVVPARAGVIRKGGPREDRGPGRPRASGGHPDGRRLMFEARTSSPRERGSSRLVLRMAAEFGLVISWFARRSRGHPAD